MPAQNAKFPILRLWQLGGWAVGLASVGAVCSPCTKQAWAESAGALVDFLEERVKLKTRPCTRLSRHLSVHWITLRSSWERALDTHCSAVGASSSSEQKWQSSCQALLHLRPAHQRQCVLACMCLAFTPPLFTIAALLPMCVCLLASSHHVQTPIDVWQAPWGPAQAFTASS